MCVSSAGGRNRRTRVEWRRRRRLERATRSDRVRRRVAADPAPAGGDHVGGRPVVVGRTAERRNGRDRRRVATVPERGRRGRFPRPGPRAGRRGAASPRGRRCVGRGGRLYPTVGVSTRSFFRGRSGGAERREVFCFQSHLPDASKTNGVSSPIFLLFAKRRRGPRNRHRRRRPVLASSSPGEPPPPDDRDTDGQPGATAAGRSWWHKTATGAAAGREPPGRSPPPSFAVADRHGTAGPAATFATAADHRGIGFVPKVYLKPMTKSTIESGVILFDEHGVRHDNVMATTRRYNKFSKWFPCLFH